MSKYSLYALWDNRIVNWTMAEILHEINHNHSDEWTDYNASDNLQEALEEWTQYRLASL